MEDSTIFYRPTTGRVPLTQQRSIVAELFSSALGAAVTDWRDSRVCHHFLAGLCVSTLFRAGKAAVMPCDRLHDESLQRSYAAARRAGEPGYEAELIRFLEDLLSRNDRDAVTNASRATIDGVIPPRIDADHHADIDAHMEIIAAKAAEFEAAGATTASLTLEEELTTVTREKFVTQARLARAADISTTTQHRMCIACGHALNLADNDERLADHFMGSIHQGFFTIRKTLRRLLEGSRAAVPNI